ncbi:MAG: hypothetical protein QG639_83, partial [Patescibacteria group bacterium]|nr:hypothetical protein [Patescibacteria group bacterium]
WTILQDGWTKLRGFGLHNVSLQKLYEQFFDLNIGIFWYMPTVFIAAIIGWFLSFKKNFLITIAPVLVIITALFYQTNPGWHYGTSGFGPGRHGLFAIPFVLYFAYLLFKKLPEMVRWIVVLVVIATQLPFLAMNNFLEPHLDRTLYNSPIAAYVLSNHPQLYNPTPEIFIDRTNHTDVTFPTSAFYKVNGKCTKAYVLNHEVGLIETNCGTVPAGITAIVDNPYKRIANYSRSVVTPEITFWPESDSCADWFTPTPEKPYVCMRTVQEVMQHTGMEDPSRITQLEEFPYPGIWKITYGDPVEVNIPAGYVVDHYSFEGAYVTFAQ